MTGEYSVCQFFGDGSYEYVRRFVDAEEAMRAAGHYMTGVGAQLGLTRRVIVTDGGDRVAFEWRYGVGVTFPPLGAPPQQRIAEPSP